MPRRIPALCLAFLAVSAASARQDGRPRFDLPRDSFLIDEQIPIVIEGLPPHAPVAIELRGGSRQNQQVSEASFTADDAGRIDAAKMAPASGSYSGVDAMGLFWSAKPQHPGAGPIEPNDEPGAGLPWTLSARVGGKIVAETTVTRRAVDPSVKVTRVRDRGLVATFYEPADSGRHPAMIVLTGSGGGMPPAAGPAGGLASRGYAVLALAYFNYERLPPTLSNIPLEYFGTALEWLAAQPSVDPARIGVLGGSRGAELALLLGVLYPHLHAVAAFEPSNRIWRGCCDRFSAVAWTLDRQPVALAEIPVEKIQGAVFLVSGKDDGVWDSSGMGDAIVDRLKRNHFAYPVRHLSYPHTGHAIGRPYTTTENINNLHHPLTGRVINIGGSPAGTAHAREDSWRELLAFLEANLKRLPPSQQ
jgi:dienelactone hydrolase